MSSALVAPSSLLLSWFGCCSYRKLKVTVEIKRKVCPICQHDLGKLRYIGNNPDILGVFGSSRSSRGRLDFLADAVEDGRLAWIVDAKDGLKNFGQWLACLCCGNASVIRAQRNIDAWRDIPFFLFVSFAYVVVFEV